MALRRGHSAVYLSLFLDVPSVFPVLGNSGAIVNKLLKLRFIHVTRPRPNLILKAEKTNPILKVKVLPPGDAGCQVCSGFAWFPGCDAGSRTADFSGVLNAGNGMT